MELREYQKEDVIRMLQQDTIANFSEQRTGKTPTTCVAMKYRKAKHTLIVCPASLMYVWKLAWEQWTGWSAYVMQTTSDDLTQLSYDTALIVNYEKLRGTKKQSKVCEQVLKWKPEAIIVDEAHRMKDRQSLTYESIKKFIKVPVRVALTGTPAPNKPWDVWTVLHWLYPKMFTGYWNFIKGYFEEETLYINGTSFNQPTRFKTGMDLVLQKQLDNKCIQHKRKDVMRWLPSEEEATCVVLPPTKQQLDMIDSFVNYFKYKDILTQSILDNLIRVRQVCNSPEILGIKGKSPKIEWLQQYLKDYPDKHVLVFSNSKKFLYILDKTLKETHSLICGDVQPVVRQGIVTAFQEGKYQVLLCQTQACKEGLTLDTADVSIFMDVYPPSADYLQAKDRMIATTPERNKPKELIHVMLQGTYDEKTFALVQRNVDETAIINDYKQYLQERRNAHGEQ